MNRVAPFPHGISSAHDTLHGLPASVVVLVAALDPAASERSRRPSWMRAASMFGLVFVASSRKGPLSKWSSRVDERFLRWR